MSRSPTVSCPCPHGPGASVEDQPGHLGIKQPLGLGILTMDFLREATATSWWSRLQTRSKNGRAHRSRWTPLGALELGAMSVGEFFPSGLGKYPTSLNKLQRPLTLVVAELHQRLDLPWSCRYLAVMATKTDPPHPARRTRTAMQRPPSSVDESSGRSVQLPHEQHQPDLRCPPGRAILLGPRRSTKRWPYSKPS